MAILAGQRIKALDFAGYGAVHDWANDTMSGLTGGVWTPPPTTVGVSFMAPSSGAVKCTFAGRIRAVQGGAFRASLACELRTGAVLGSGVVVDEPDTDRAIEIGSNTTDFATQVQASTFRVHEGLTPGQLYHFRFMALAASNGDIVVYARSIAVEPWHG